jgi:hypothetical protein
VCGSHFRKWNCARNSSQPIMLIHPVIDFRCKLQWMQCLSVSVVVAQDAVDPSIGLTVIILMPFLHNDVCWCRIYVHLETFDAICHPTVLPIWFHADVSKHPSNNIALQAAPSWNIYVVSFVPSRCRLFSTVKENSSVSSGIQKVHVEVAGAVVECIFAL